MENPQKTIINYVLDFFQYCEKDRDFSDKTIENYGRYLNRFIRWLKTSNLPHLKPKDLSTEIISAYKEHLSTQKIKPITINFYLIALRAFLSYLSEKDIPCPISAQKIKLPKKEKEVRKDTLNAMQLKKLLTVPDTSHNIGLRDRAILEIISSTGLKVAEFASINKDDVKIDNFSNRAIFKVSDRKENVRSVYVPQKATEWLIKYLNNRKDNDKALFINYRKRKENHSLPLRLTARSIERIVQKYGKAIDFPYAITPEFLRNAYIKSILESEPSIIKNIYDHQNLIVKKYVPNISTEIRPDRSNKIDWDMTENRIKLEILWLKNNIDTLPEGYRSKDILITCEDCILRKLAVLIVSGKIKAKKMKFEQSPWKDNYELNENHRHGEEWHRKMMNAVANYFKGDGYQTALEPIINFGRADIGIFSKSLKSPIYIEIGTTSLYKLLYNLLTMENSIFLIIPSEENMIEFRT